MGLLLLLLPPPLPPPSDMRTWVCGLDFCTAWCHFLSPLPHRWWFVVCVLCLQCETWETSRGTSYDIVCLESYSKCRKSWKWNKALWSSDKLIFKSIALACTLDQTFHIFRYGWIECRNAFPAFSVIMLCNGHGTHFVWDCWIYLCRCPPFFLYLFTYMYMYNIESKFANFSLHFFCLPFTMNVSWYAPIYYTL